MGQTAGWWLRAKAWAHVDATLARGLLWRLSLALIFSMLGLTLLVDHFSRREVEAKALDELRSTVIERARASGEDFALAERHVELLRAEYLRRLAAPRPPGWQAQFRRWFARSPDRLLRLRPELDDHRRRPSVYLRPQAELDDSLMWQTLIAFELLQEWGPPLTARYYSAYFDLPGKGLIMFSPSVNWGAEATPETNNFDYPPVAGASPENNPGRANRWTPVYYDDKARIYMVSTVLPIDLEGQWVACVSQDVSVASLLKRTVSDSAPGTYNLILSRDGHLIAHPGFAARIEAAQGNLKLDQLRDPLLDEIAALAPLGEGQARVSASRDGRHLLGVARIQGPDWLFVTVYPRALLDAGIARSSETILMVAAVALAVLMSLLGWIVRRQISRPIAELQSAVQGVAAGQFKVTLPQAREDELGELGRSFEHMGAELARREARLTRDALALQEARDLLESRVGERTAELHASNSELVLALDDLGKTQSSLRRAERLASLGRLVAGVAHEMGTPIGNARLAATTLAAEAEQMEAAVQAGLRRSQLMKFLRHVSSGSHILQSNLERASDLLQNFKQVAVDGSSAQRQCFDLGGLVNQVLSSLEPTLKRLPLRVEVHIPDGLDLDSYPGALGQVLANLIQNAAVHAFEGREQGQVEVLADCPDAEHVRLRIRDDGCGIPSEIQSRVFDPFFTTRMGRGGTGLGLNISHNLVSNVLCGEIHLHSEPGAGSCFELLLPRVAPSQAEAETLPLPLSQYAELDSSGPDVQASDQRKP